MTILMPSVPVGLSTIKDIPVSARGNIGPILTGGFNGREPTPIGVGAFGLSRSGLRRLL